MTFGNPFLKLLISRPAPHPMAMMANMPDPFLALPGMRPQAVHHQRRQMRSQAAHSMRMDGLTINAIADQLHISPTTVSGYFRDP